MLIRIRSKDGTFRFELAPTMDARELAAKILETTEDCDEDTLTVSNQPRGGETKVKSLYGRSLATLGLKNADLIFVAYNSRSQGSSTLNGTINGGPLTAPSQQEAAITETRQWENVEEDPVDTYWRALDGKIPRARDSRFCKHGANAMCDYCMPLEPYDFGYHKEHAIKHLSYHAYLRKLTPPNKTSSTSSLPPLTPLSYKVKVPCPTHTHAPWPGGICTACQPSAITLQSQPWRAVDHIEFASPEIVDKFLEPWRQTGNQRFGWLIGRYAPYDKVPMGIKAVVEVIHEPPQEGNTDGLSLELPWEDEERVIAFAHAAGMNLVGTVFTDLSPTPEDKTKVIYKRHQGSFYLSSLEASFAAQIQLSHPNPSRSSPTGIYGSRIVTTILTGDDKGDVSVAAYQVSEQACAMLDADMIEPSVDPGTMRVKEEESGRYVPDVFYRFKNDYGLEVKQSAKPCFPVEYLLVNVTHGFPTNPTPAFLSTTFQIENRPEFGKQDVTAIIRALAQLHAPAIQDSRHGGGKDIVQRKQLLTFLSDWHLLAFLGSVGVLSESDMQVLLRAAISPNVDDPAVLDDLLVTEGWSTLMTIVHGSEAPARPTTSAPSLPNPDQSFDIPQDMYEEAQHGGNQAGATRTCPHCTFENPVDGGPDCEVCGLPLSG